MSHGRLGLRVLSGVLFLMAAAFLISSWRYSRAVSAWENARAAIRADPRACAQRVEQYQRLAGTLSGDPSFIRDYADCLRTIGKTEQSAALLVKAARRHNDPELLEDLATARARAGDYSGAIESARAAAEMSPWRLSARWQLASFLYRKGNHEAAYEYAREILVTPTRMLKNQTIEVKQRSRRLLRNWKASPQWSEEIGPTLNLVDPEHHGDLAKALWVAGPNAGQIRDAFPALPETYRAALAFLVIHMPEPDLASLTTEFLVDHVQSAMAAREAYPFTREIPDEIFRRYVLPYYQLGESREAWREPTRRRVAPYLDGVQERHLAVQALVEAFPLYGVAYDTVFFGVYRARSPSQTLKRGQGDCFDGAVFFSNILRSVGIPARIIAIPRWYGGRGGHAWVEAYENELWRPIGIFDPPRDAGWFLEWAGRTDAAKAEHRIYAATFERTDINIPVYGPHVWWHDVTDRYVPTEPLPPGPLEP